MSAPEVPQSWGDAGDPAYTQYLIRAREGFLQGQAFTLAQVKAAYRRAATALAKDLKRKSVTPSRRAVLEAAQAAITYRVARLSADVLTATELGIRLTVRRGTAAQQQITADAVRGWLPQEQVAAAFGANQIGSMPHDLAMENIRLTATEVVPKLRHLWEDEWEDKWWPKPLQERKRPAPVYWDNVAVS